MKYQDDSFYIERILKGETSAYAILVEKHKNLVFSIALKILNNREDAEEVAQDVFVKAYQSLGGFKGKSKFSTWLYRIVYNASISRTRKKKPALVEVDGQMIQNFTSETHHEEDFSEAEEHQRMLQMALKRLNENDNLLITLFYHGQKSIEEIGFIMGLSESNVKVRLHRIRKKLHDEMTLMMNRKPV